VTELNIPAVAYAVVDQSIGCTGHARAAIKIAAPLIVASKLRQILSEPRVSEWPGFVQIALNDIADDLDIERLAQ
jgi:hypothetical protein